MHQIFVCQSSAKHIFLGPNCKCPTSSTGLADYIISIIIPGYIEHITIICFLLTKNHVELIQSAMTYDTGLNYSIYCVWTIKLHTDGLGNHFTQTVVSLCFKIFLTAVTLSQRSWNSSSCTVLIADIELNSHMLNAFLLPRVTTVKDSSSLTRTVHLSTVDGFASNPWTAATSNLLRHWGLGRSRMMMTNCWRNTYRTVVARH